MPLTPSSKYTLRVTHAEASLASTPVLPCGHAGHKGTDPRFDCAVFELQPTDGVSYAVHIDEDGFPYVEVTGTATTLPIVFTAIGSCMDGLHGKFARFSVPSR